MSGRTIALAGMALAVVGTVAALGSWERAWAGDGPPGDVNCDGSVNSIDVAILLHYHSAEIGPVPCPLNGDVSQDGILDAVDAALILQFSDGLLVSLPPDGTPPAGPAATGTVGIGSGTAEPGEQVSVDLTSNVGPPGLGAWTVDFEYDPSVVSVDFCDPEQGGVCNEAFTPTSVRITGVSAGGLTGETSLGSITFVCASSEGTSPLTVTPEVFADATIGYPLPMEPDLTNGTITCAFGPGPPGDASCDGSVNGIDVAILLHYHSGEIGSVPCPLNGDVSQDGILDAVDAALIAQLWDGLLVSLPPEGTPPAGPAATGTVGIGSGTAELADQVSVDLVASVGPPGLGAWTVDIAYDPSVVALVSCRPAHGGVCNEAFAPTSVRITGVSAGGLTGETLLGSITFVCASSEGTSPLTVTPQLFSDATIGFPLPMEPDVTHGAVTCAGPTPTPTFRFPDLGAAGPTSGSDSALRLALLLGALGAALSTAALALLQRGRRTTRALPAAARGASTEGDRTRR